jgi:carbon-monoxide dehydrogenase medium subunit
MKFPAFDYVAPLSLRDAIAILEADEDAKVLAGGQSLLPLLALRLARPSVLVDLRHADLEDVAVSAGEIPGDTLTVGSMTLQVRLGSDPVIAAAAPLLADAVGHVGHQATRNRGTLGGSVAHSDPSAELPAALVALGASVTVHGPHGQRHIACRNLADGYFTTTLAPAEVITEIRVPIAGARHGASWCEWAARSGDFAEAGCGVAVELDPDGACRAVMAAACAVAPTPVELSGFLAPVLTGVTSTTPEVLRQVASVVRRNTAAAGDDKSELVSLLAARAVKRAFDSASAKVDGRYPAQAGR